MNTIYFISYVFKKRGKLKFGSSCFEIAEPITEKNFDIVVDHLERILKATEVVILTFKEVKGGAE